MPRQAKVLITQNQASSNTTKQHQTSPSNLMLRLRRCRRQARKDELGNNSRHAQKLSHVTGLLAQRQTRKSKRRRISRHAQKLSQITALLCNKQAKKEALRKYPGHAQRLSHDTALLCQRQARTATQRQAPPSQEKVPSPRRIRHGQAQPSKIKRRQATACCGLPVPTANKKRRTGEK